MQDKNPNRYVASRDRLQAEFEASRRQWRLKAAGWLALTMIFAVCGIGVSTVWRNITDSTIFQLLFIFCVSCFTFMRFRCMADGDGRQSKD